ncbi:hypothetical protein NMY22_g16741 [Coprinellus aureogranulatus]|nr:hypothetical protein NMY22_g16741 [Coprinellus aureogranulatus]
MELEILSLERFYPIIPDTASGRYAAGSTPTDRGTRFMGDEAEHELNTSGKRASPQLLSACSSNTVQTPPSIYEALAYSYHIYLTPTGVPAFTIRIPNPT